MEFRERVIFLVVGFLICNFGYCEGGVFYREVEEIFLVREGKNEVEM